MKKRSDVTMREECDFTGAVRANYAERHAEGAHIVKLDPDVAEVFPNAQSVNEALRALAAIIRSHRAVADAA
jgi:hypothetical protein